MYKLIPLRLQCTNVTHMCAVSVLTEMVDSMLITSHIRINTLILEVYHYLRVVMHLGLP